MIDIERFSFWYPGATTPIVHEVDLQVAEGSFALLVGATGSGKSTLLRAINGLVPHFTGGHVEGRVRACGLDPRHQAPREFAAAVGVVGQDPLAGFVTDTVEEELAYGMEQLGTAPAVMRRRVEETLDLMGVAHLRRRALRTLSGGEQQRVAFGAALTTSPRVLVLDEPTSALDPGAAEDALAAVLRLVHDLGVTVIASEHRLERVVEYADLLAVVEGGQVRAGAPADLIRASPVAPPVVELGRLVGWDPLPLSVRDARRMAGPLREQLRGLSQVMRQRDALDGRDAVVVEGVSVEYGATAAVSGVSLELATGEVVALMGRNGSGKSSLLWALQGSGARTSGRVLVDGVDPSSLSPVEALRRVAMVPQQATDLLFHPTVRRECGAADAASGAPAGRTRELLDELVDAEAVEDDVHPRDLSEGQRLGLALAVQLASEPLLLLLDEPTRGLDYRAKHRLAEVVARLAAGGRVVLIATHDVEFAAQVSDRVVVLARGQVVADASAAEVLAASPVFAPQVAKVLAPSEWLTPGQVAEAVTGTGRDLVGRAAAAQQLSAPPRAEAPHG